MPIFGSLITAANIYLDHTRTHMHTRACTHTHINLQMRETLHLAK